MSFLNHITSFQVSIGLKEPFKDIEFAFDYVDGLYYKCNNIILNRGDLYIYSTAWLKNRKVPINPKLNDNSCSQYALIVALNHENIENRREIILKINPFINKNNWKDMSYVKL